MLDEQRPRLASCDSSGKSMARLCTALHSTWLSDFHPLAPASQAADITAACASSCRESCPCLQAIKPQSPCVIAHACAPPPPSYQYVGNFGPFPKPPTRAYHGTIPSHSVRAGALSWDCTQPLPFTLHVSSIFHGRSVSHRPWL